MALPTNLEALIERLAARDPRAFAALYDQTSGFVFGLLVHILNDHASAEEVAQDVYLQLWRSAATFDPQRSSALAWIAIVTRSRAIDRLRADASYRGALEQLRVERQNDPPTEPEDPAMRSETRRRVRAALGALSEEQRTAIELAFFQGLSHSEISRRTETPLGTVKTRIRAALGKLEETLGSLRDGRP